jgi:hypothetical protein
MKGEKAACTTMKKKQKEKMIVSFERKRVGLANNGDKGRGGWAEKEPMPRTRHSACLRGALHRPGEILIKSSVLALILVFNNHSRKYIVIVQACSQSSAPKNVCSCVFNHLLAYTLGT